MNVRDMRQKFRECHAVFEARVFPNADYSRMCDIHSVFGSLAGPRHNCLGCNFAETTTWLRNFLKRHDQFESVEEAFNDYFLKMYLLVERVYVIFDIISLPKEYRFRHFSVLQDVHKWANFIKHPQAFLLAHHPVRSREGAPGFDSSQYKPVIDQAFVQEYYSGPDNNRKLTQLLRNCTTAAVMYPDPVKVIQRFCDALDLFVDVITKNPVYRDVLADRTTYDSYFSSPAAEASGSS
jgi:hypothetical protein